MGEPASFLDELSEAAVWRLEEVCSRFEEAWMTGRRPRVKEALAGTAGPERTALLRELVRLEVYYRRAAGEVPTAEEYVTCFGDAQGVLAELFGATGSASVTTDLPARSPDATQTGIDAADGPASATLAPPLGARRYRPLRFHAAGNLGEVYVAEDVELNREVALKEIQTRHADRPEQRARFRLEGEVTGRLEHPGIVPVYGMGTYPDGRPYYAMRFIRGETLADAIARFHAVAPVHFDSIEFRQLLGRFLAVCQAVGYAHSRGVLHRDLKPANIMLGPFGETLVVDWGLAKFLGGTDEDPPVDGADTARRVTAGGNETEVGSILGTPAFMSPEQAAGRVNALGPATDVYALGATLHAVLTGRPPLSGALTEVLARVRTGEWAPPRQVLPAVPAALEAVCLKGTALAPEQRYPSAVALGADVERWLADEPVTAYREPRLARARRWVRKHPRSVTAAGVALVAAVLGLTVVAGLIRKSEQEAKKQFAITRDAVRKLLVSVNEDDLLHEPGMQPLRQKLLTDALNYYDEFLKTRPGDQDVLQEKAEANRQVGELYAEAGRFELAGPRIAWSIRGFDDLRARGRDTREVRLGLGRAYLAQAGLPDAEGGGLAAADRAVELLAAVTAESPEDPATLRLLGRGHQVRSAALARAGRLDRALEDNAKAGRTYWTAAFVQFQEFPGTNYVLLRHGGGADEPRGYYLASYHVLSAWLDRAKQLELAGWKPEAARAYVTAARSARWFQDHYSFLQAYHPRRTRLRIALAEALLGLGRVQTDLGHPAAAKPALEEARDLARGFLLDAPTAESARYVELLADVNACLGRCLLDLGRTALAESYLREAAAQDELPAARADAGHALLKRHARTLAALARSAHESDCPTEAVPLCERTLAALDRSLALVPWDLELQSNRLDARELLSRARAASGAIGRDARLREQRRLLDERAELAGGHPSLSWVQAKAGQSAAELARILLGAGQPVDALATVAAVLPGHERAVREDGLAQRLIATPPTDPAEAALGARAVVSRLDPDGYPRHFTTREPAREPEDFTLRRAWAELLAAKGAALAASGRRDDAAGCARQAVEIATELAQGGFCLPGAVDPLQPGWAAVATLAARREPGYLYDLARHLAFASTQLEPGDDPAGRAVGALRALLAVGYDAPARLAHDPRLAPLRDRDDFRRLVGGDATKK